MKKVEMNLLVFFLYSYIINFQQHVQRQSLIFASLHLIVKQQLFEGTVLLHI